MKNRITELFKRKKEKVLSVFFTAGYPLLNNTAEIIKLLQEQGADMVEIGIPFSDPLADGPVIQKSSEEALKNGMTLKLLFEQLKDLRKEVSVPLVLMGYVNPVLQFGMENFIIKCKETGIDGVILPDLPIDVYMDNYKSLFEENQVSFVFLVTSKTSAERIKLIDSISTGFIYLVSFSGTTGGKVEFDKNGYSNIRSLHLKNPSLIGFGISDNETFEKACSFSNGVIIGSAFVKELEKGNPSETIPVFIESILNKKTISV